MPVSMIGPKFYAWDRDGNPLAFGKLYTYKARTNAPKATFQSEDGIVENTNPVILNGEGYANVYLEGSYKVVLKDAQDNEIWSADPVSATSAEEWVDCVAASYLSTSSFKVPGNVTDKYQTGQQIRITDGASYYLNSISESIYSGGETTITTLISNIPVTITTVCRSIISIESSSFSITLQDAISMPWKIGQSVKTDGYLTLGDGGGADYIVVEGGTGTPDGGSYHNCNNGLQLKLLILGNIIVSQWGVVTGNVDNTAQYEAINASLVGGETIEWINAGGVYRGEAIFTKSVNLKGNGATVQDWDTTKQIIGVNAHLPSADFNSHAVLEAELNHGDISFTVTNASSLFAAGDIGYLWDGAVRPTGGDVNFECVKIKAISGNVITVEGALHANKSVSNIYFYHTTNQIKKVLISDFKVKASAAHQNVGVYVVGCDQVVVEKISTEDTLGNAISVRYSYDVVIDTTRHNKPAAVGSGEGYGAAISGVTKFSIRDVKGSGMRHMVDIASSYYGSVDDVEDADNQNSIVEASHNGFTGYLNVTKVRGTTKQYPVDFAGDGYGTKGAGNAEKVDHPLRSVTVRDIDVSINETKTVNDFNVSGVYINQNTLNVSIYGIKAVYLNQTALAVDDISSTMVRINGISLGGTTIEDVFCDRIGNLIFSDGNGSGASPSADVTTITNLNASIECNAPVFMQGPWRARIDDISCGAVIGVTDPAIIKMQSSASGTTQSMFIGDSIYYAGVTVPIYKNVSGVLSDGYFQGVSRSMTLNVGVVDGGSISAEDIQNRSGSVSIEPPGAGAITMAVDALPIPYIQGQVINIYNTLNTSDANRGPVTFPGNDAGTNPTSTLAKSFTIADDGTTQRLIARAGMWYLN